MPLEALFASDNEMVPVGAIELWCVKRAPGPGGTRRGGRVQFAARNRYSRPARGISPGRGAVVPALENVALWHERDISHSSVERMIGPDATVIVLTADHIITPIEQFAADAERAAEIDPSWEKPALFRSDKALIDGDLDAAEQ